MHRIECLHLAYVCIEFYNKSCVWAVGSFEWGTWHNVLRDRQGNFKVCFQFQIRIFLKCVGFFCNKSCFAFFFVSETRQVPRFFKLCNLICGHGWIRFQFSEALWICILELWRFSGAGYFLWGPQVCNCLGPNRWISLPWKIVSALPAKPTIHFDPVTPCLLHILAIPVLL